MRIDLNHGPQQLPETNRRSAHSTGTGTSSLGNIVEGEDQAQISDAHVQIQALVTQASQLPEVREERVQALRQAIESGRYQASPQKIGGAMFAHMVAEPVA